jgi:ABC-type amino acid transport system permease subunit
MGWADDLDDGLRLRRAFYFVFCFGMSRYSAMLERGFSAGRKR